MPHFCITYLIFFLGGEIRVQTLSAAINFAIRQADRGIAMGWSIVLYGGLYIDPFGKLGGIDEAEAHYGLCLEIVGLGEVRLLLQTNQLLLCGIDLTMKNLSIYDRRQNVFEFVVCEIHTAILKLYGVNIEIRDKDTFNVCGGDAKVEAVNCFLTKGLQRCEVMWACNFFGIRWRITLGGLLFQRCWLLDSR